MLPARSIDVGRYLKGFFIYICVIGRTIVIPRLNVEDWHIFIC